MLIRFLVSRCQSADSVTLLCLNVVLTERCEIFVVILTKVCWCLCVSELLSPEVNSKYSVQVVKVFYLKAERDGIFF